VSLERVIVADANFGLGYFGGGKKRGGWFFASCGLKKEEIKKLHKQTENKGIYIFLLFANF
jgi:hypothetical protein